MVSGIFCIQLNHHLVAGDFGNNRGGGDTSHLRVTVNHIALVGDRAQRVSIHQNAIGFKPGIGNGARDGLAKSRCHANGIDALGRYVAGADRDRFLRDSGS